MNKRTLIIIGFIIVVIAFGVMIYFVFIKDLVKPTNNNGNTNATNPVNINGGLPTTNTVPITNSITNGNTNGTIIIPGGNTNQSGISPVAQGGLTEATAAVNTAAQAAMVGADGKSLNFYDKAQGKFFKIDANGKTVALSDQLFPDAKDIAWSPTGDKAVVSFPDNSKIVYDFNTKQQVTLPKEWEDIKFSPSGDKLGFQNLSADVSNRWLAVANTDGTGTQSIEPLGDNAGGVAVNWSPDGQVLATFRQAVDGATQEVLLIGLNGENFKALPVEGRGFEGKWSPSGDQLLYSVYSAETNYNPTVYLVDAKGDTIGANKIAVGLQTWPSKCIFSKKSAAVYCAVPDSLPSGAGLAPNLASSVRDLIYEINTDSGAKSVIALPTVYGQDRYTISGLMLSGDEQTMYFQDSASGKVYSIKLP
jgi:WD40 repeat protein